MRKKRPTNRLINRRKSLTVDISFGGTTQPGALTLAPRGDVRQDPRMLPFRLPANSVDTAVVTHVLEYIPGVHWWSWWDELHRVMKPGGVVYLSGPYGGDESVGWLSDPTHVTRVVEQTFCWLDPRLPFYAEHERLGRPAPRPWLTQTVARVPGAHGTVSYNVSLRKAVPK